MVEIEEHEGKRPPVAERALDLDRSLGHEMAPVVCARQLVFRDQLLKASLQRPAHGDVFAGTDAPDDSSFFVPQKRVMPGYEPNVSLGGHESHFDVLPGAA